jgi:hypothetical protein
MAMSISVAESRTMAGQDVHVGYFRHVLLVYTDLRTHIAFNFSLFDWPRIRESFADVGSCMTGQIFFKVSAEEKLTNSTSFFAILT